MRFSHQHPNHHRHHHPRHDGVHRQEFMSRGGPPGQHWDEERGRGRRHRLFDAAGLRLILLKLISDQPRHGYDLIRAIDELTAGNYVPSAGVVYPALSVLQDLNHIEAAASGGARKAFAITADGTAELAANADQVAELFARLAALAAPREGADSSPIRRAMENLRAVLRHRFGETALEKNTVHEIAAILDEAAQRIERL